MDIVGIEPAGPHDAEALAQVHARAFDAPWSAADLREVLASPFTLALQAGSPPCGFIAARAVAGEAEILTLAVDPTHRRGGLGRALVLAAAGLAAAAGTEVLWLEVALDNAAARALYAGLGFEPAGRRPGYYARTGGAVDALVLRCTLNRAPP